MLNRFNTNNLRGDAFGGLTAAVIALPMALAFGIAVGNASGVPEVGAAAGLWGAVIIGLVASLFGGTPTLISEPTGPMTVVFTSVVISFASTAESPEKALAMAFTVGVLAGVFQILFGLFRLGRYITMMPYTVISGFMSGIGIILVLLQLAPFLGQDPKGGVMGTLSQLPALIQGTQPMELSLAVITLAILWFTPSALKKVCPPQLLALVVGTLLAVSVFSGAGLRTIPSFSAEFPSLSMPDFSGGQIRMMVVNAAVLGMLGCIDALLTSVVADSLTRTEHDSNKELIGQGLANVASGLFGALPGAGATMGTVVNIQAGGRTALSGVIRAVVLMLVVLLAAPLASMIPLAVLAGIALKVGIDIIDWEFLKRAHHLSPKAAVITYGVIVLTVLVDLITAVGIGVFVANVLTIDRMSALQSKKVKTISTTDDDVELSEEEQSLLDQAAGKVLLFQLAGPMIFGVAKAISREHNAIGNCQAVVFDLSEVSHLGVTAAIALENAVKEAMEVGRQVFMVGATGSTANRLRKLKLLERLPERHITSDRLQALQLAVAELTPNA
ncbi:MAG: SulP family inorganic anion transporter [Synechococcus sp. BS301-5m-G54]|uniref:SulP family inorganic anion transporter n=1 Tax=Synechococcales TaxID=1890424 RepID=UPI0004E06E39|nr:MULTISPECIES: SulP family inorganic anion transporter [unclassified Synechococcus]MBL6739480.1 SulP family inorganic anion transporter [Synechococcus sp. BS301-5m-G54]MBL6795799.1 SulP family inorganic anion transporter [Synechococcus sp. BS307-5m-G34]RCL53760.1 MAG: SulP family inorganic anion transporter [Synechococcus sp. MED-G70]AII44922.1 bicarbonate transporter [Synechococcus sp. KORDI-49]QNI94154.1 SulP-type bicarbonate transporter [Synechococcus sp. A15-127]